VSLGIRLLGDLRRVFGVAAKVTTEQLLEALNRLDDAPWADLRGKPLDARGLARRLRPYDVRPRVIKVGDTTFRGYVREELHDAWQRYLPESTRDDVTSETGKTVSVVTSVTDPESDRQGPT
jgi:hypothetical protein